MKPTINAVYISVLEMNRAVKFYEEILETNVTHHDERMSEFKMGDFSLLLYNPKADGQSPVFGDNTVINIQVDDVATMLTQVAEKGCKVVMPITTIGDNLVFQVEDQEGNIVEFYQLTEKIL